MSTATSERVIFLLLVVTLPNNAFSRTLKCRKICKLSWLVSTFLARKTCNLACSKVFNLYLRSVHRDKVAICDQGFLRSNSKSRLIYLFSNKTNVA